MNKKTRTYAWLRHATVATSVVACTLSVHAQTTMATSVPQIASSNQTLKQVFDAAWARQPEAMALQARRDATHAQQRAAQAWTPEPVALELSSKTDRLDRNQGSREIEVGISVALWLPGERSRSAALANAERAAIESRTNAAQLRVAATVREAWWQWQRALIDSEAARDLLANTQRIAEDVARRAKAGELARADQHQADGAVASAEASIAQAKAGLAVARQHLGALAGAAFTPGEAVKDWAEPALGAAPAETEEHAALQELMDRAVVAERAAALTENRSRANPELTLAATRDRGAFGESAQQTLTLGLRIPFGGGPRHAARSANAHADATEVQAQLVLERERLASEREAARIRVEASRTQLVAAERRAVLARESRGFFDKSFRLGETDLPTRLRIEAEAAEAERHSARVRIELSAAISAWRQALGLLPQ